MNELAKIKIGSKVYESFVATYFDSDFDAILKTDDISAVKSDFSDIEEFWILSASGLVMDKLTTYHEIKSIAELPDYYSDDEGNLKSAIQIVLKKTDISSRLKILEEKVNPFVNESTLSLDEYKELKISETKSALKEYLESHPITSTAHGGVPGLYSITEEKQTLMMQNYMTYQIEKSISPETARLTWNQTGEECEEFTEEEFLTLTMEIKAKIYPLVSYQQSIEKKIRDATSKDEILAINYSYDNVGA